jgi:hypothetical protein
MHRFCATSRAETPSQLTLAARCSSTFNGRLAMNNLKLRALPLVGALSLIASMAGYLGGR